MSIREELDLLLALQDIDSKRDISLKSRSKIDNGNDAKSALDKAKIEAESAKVYASQSAAALKDAELELASVESKIKSYEQKMNSGSLTNAKEIANVEKEMHQLNRQRGALDDKILNLMDQAESSKSASDAKAEHLKHAYQSLEDQKSLSRQSLDHLNTQLNRLESERSSLVECLTKSTLLTKYEALRQRPAAVGLAIVKIDSDRHCGGCHLPVSQQDFERVKEAKGLVLCENCGRILA
jgi:predicted  nucleic acid-binding Zn-ribbon protein